MTPDGRRIGILWGDRQPGSAIPMTHQRPKKQHDEPRLAE